MSTPLQTDTGSDPLPRLRRLALFSFAGVAAALLLIAALAFAALELEDAVRSYVEGESLYSKAQKEAVIALQSYVRSGDADDWKRYREAIRVPLGDRQARRALQRRPPDLRRAREGFRQGGLQADEIGGMIRLFLWFGDWEPMRRSIELWSEADSLVTELRGEARRVRNEWRSERPDTSALSAAAARIGTLNEALARRERQFTETIDRAADRVRRWSQLGIGGLTLILLAVSGGISWRTYRRLRNREEALRRSERRYRRLFEQTLVGVLRTEPHRGGEVLECNHALAEMLGFDRPEEVVGRSVADFYPGGRADREDALDSLLDEGDLVRFGLELRRRDGEPIWVLGHSRLVDDPVEGKVIEGLYFDITERVRTADRLQEREERFRQMAESIEEVFWLRDPENEEMLYVSPAYETVWGRPVEQLYENPQQWMEAIHPDDKPRVAQAVYGGEGAIEFDEEYRIVRPDGEVRWVRDQGFPVEDEEGEVYRVAGVARDITEQKELEQQLRHQALHDPLTGLANRTLLTDRLEQGLVRAERHDEALGLLMLDVDQFKRINDRLGHAAGDRVLTELARRLREAVRDEDTVARWGGDEFAVVLPELHGPEGIQEVRGRIQDAVREPIEASGESVRVDMSIGAVIRGDAAHRRAVQTDDPEEFLRFGSLALHWAKEEAPRGFRFFDSEEQVEGNAQIRRERELREALDEGQIVPYYQPIVRLEDGSLADIEVLARWRHPERGLVLPAEFVPLAEELGLIGDLERNVIRQACREVSAWGQEAGTGSEIRFGFNVSARQFRNPDVADQLSRLVRDAGGRPERITLEVTETSLMRVPERIVELRELGFRVSVDDFGTGYSTFSYLRDLEVDELKIDISFVQGITDSESDAALVETMIELGERLGLAVIAEGIETEAQRGVLRTLGCGLGQGFLFGRPVPGEELADRWLSGGGR